MEFQEFEEEEFDTQFNGQLLLRILRLTKPHLVYAVGFLLAISLAAVLDTIFTFLSKEIIDEAIVPGNLAALREYVGYYFGLVIVQAGVVFTFIYCAGRLGEQVQYDLRKKLFHRLQELSFSYFDRTPLGWIMSRVTSDTQRVGELVSWGLLDITWGVTGIGAALVAMFVINARLSLIVGLIIPILVIVASQFQRYILKEYREVRKLNSKITGAFNENISGVRVVQALTREEANMEEFSQLTSGMYQAGFRAAWLSALFLPVVQFISALGIGATAWYGGWQAQLGGMTIGEIQAFVSYITFMLWPVQEMARVYAEMQQAIASAERVFSLEDAIPDVIDQPDATETSSLIGEIVFDHVDFYYEENKPVLQDFSVRVAPGETIALVGPTGAGKSTIVNLLCRFYEPKKGSVSIAGHNYLDLTQRALQSRIGMVLQTPHLFSGTIRENIQYGRLDATDAEIEAAAALVGANRFIKDLKNGYDEEVGEGGGLLSVGQKQLLSLARAALAQPDIFIMDEATSSVDTLTEALIQKGMEAVMSGRTSFIIAHRLSTIRRADRILVINRGKIEEAGSHEELIQKRGHYFRLYTEQFRQEKARELAIG